MAAPIGDENSGHFKHNFDELWDETESDDDFLVNAVSTYEDTQIQVPTAVEDGEKPRATTPVDLQSPLERFRPGYLWVSDLTRQNWCEQQLLYSFTLPTVVVEKPVMTEGSNIHLARELAVHDIVNVKVTSSEDVWAIKVLNLLNVVQQFLNGQTLTREVPIFGAPFGEDVFIVGLIDELRFDPESYQIDLLELKTRKFKSNPSKAQKEQHKLQVMLYKKLFDDLVKGLLSKECVAKHLRIDLSKELGEDIMKQFDLTCVTAKNLDQLMDILFMKMQSLTCVSRVFVEYVLQESSETLCTQEVEYDDGELERTYRSYLGFWRGSRLVTGVDIEEAYKCQSCEFADVCEWREKKAQEYSSKNMKK